MAGAGGITKIDSNVTGLRYVVEQSLCELPINPVWRPLEPNEYNAFGGEITTIARNPIQASRQRKKGTVTDLDANAGFQTDLTQTNIQEILQAFLFADFREKFDTQPFNGVTVPITAIDTINNEYDAASGLGGVVAGTLVFASGFGQAANNGVKRVLTSVATALRVAETLVAETPSLTARLESVGFQFPAGDAEIDATGSLPALVTTATALTTLGLVVGETVFIGGDGGNGFFSSVNNGFKRIRSIAVNRIEFDKSRTTMVNDDGTTTGAGGTNLQIQLFFGRVLRNEANPDLIKRRPIQLERTLGSNTGDTAVQAEYIIGGVASELQLNVPSAEKVTVDFTFIGTDNQVLDENNLPAFFPGAESDIVADAIKSKSVTLGSTAPPIAESDAFNTSSDIKGIKLFQFVPGNANPLPLFAFAQELTLTINNNASPNKAIGVLGSFEVTAGTFEVGGSITAYFADVAAISAVRNNADITLDFPLVKSNAGIHIDVPLISLGGGQPDVSQDEPITIPLETEAATAAKIDPLLDYTLQFVFFSFLPNRADS